VAFNISNTGSFVMKKVYSPFPPVMVCSGRRILSASPYAIVMTPGEMRKCSC